MKGTSTPVTLTDTGESTSFSTVAVLAEPIRAVT
jgi:hypothetical protein